MKNKFKVGQIVKCNDVWGEEHIGILYENGNKTYNSFRVQTLGVNKIKFLTEEDVKPATQAELDTYLMQAIAKLKPETIIQQETDECGGVLPEQIMEAPVEESQNHDEEE